MASRAIVKEARRVAGQQLSRARKRAKEANTVERLVATGVAPVGAGIAAALDAYDVGIPVGERKIPLSPIGAAVGIGIGLWAKGVVGAAALGFGGGQLNGFIYSMVHKHLVDAQQEAKEAALDEED